MNLNDAISQLEHQGSAVASLGKSVSTEQARWKPSPEDWSILEVLNHLVDEEILDFRRHLHHILFTPDEAWPEIDPLAWVIAKKYNLRNLDTTLENFKSEREKTIRWLSELKTAVPRPRMGIKVFLAHPDTPCWSFTIAGTEFYARF